VRFFISQNLFNDKDASLLKFFNAIVSFITGLPHKIHIATQATLKFTIPFFVWIVCEEYKLPVTIINMQCVIRYA